MTELKDTPDRPGGLELTGRMLRLAAFEPDARLLDVCCGDGGTVEMLLKAGFDARGIDLEPGINGLPLTRGSAYSLPFGDSSMDGILCECAFSMLEPDKALLEFARVLKTGGALLLSDLCARSEGGEMGKLRVRTREDLEALLAFHSFEIQFFEDHTDALKSFLARRIMEHGSDWLRKEIGLDFPQPPPIKCGYCILVARSYSL